MTGMPPLRDLPVGPDPLALLDPLRRALDSSGPAVRPILGAAGAGVIIERPDCVRISYPEFYDTLAGFGGE